MCLDALERNESCGGHFREEYQTPEGEAQRDDEHYSYVAAWEYRGAGSRPELCTRSRWSSNTCIPQTELQVMKIILHIWRQKNAQRQRPHGRYEVPDVNETCRSWNARRAERGPDRQGRRAGGLRPRLPRRHLRHVRLS
jgi:hypothetical protein